MAIAYLENTTSATGIDMKIINTKYGYEEATTLGSPWKQYIKCEANNKTIAIESIKGLWLDYGAATSTADSICYDYGTVTTAKFVYRCMEAATNYYRFQWGRQGECGWESVAPIRSPQDRLREMIQQRQAPAVIGTRKHLVFVQDPREIRARETLRRVLGEDKFRRFIKNGFTTVRAKSGLVYQIFPGHGMTIVYRDGQKIERLCVVLRGDFPPTDSLIMRYLLILNDEQDFRSHAVKHTVFPANMVVRTDDAPVPLPDLYRRLKVA